MTDPERVLAEVGRGLSDPLPLLAWADLLEEAGDPRAAGLRQAARAGWEPLKTLYIFPAWADTPALGWGYAGEGNPPQHYPWRLPGEVYAALGAAPEVRGEWKLWPSRAEAYLALAGALAGGGGHD